jgi:hypothetical protein
VKLTPLRRTTPKPYALLTPGHRELLVETVHGASLARGKRDVQALLEKLSPFTCYVNSGLERLKHTTGATSWTMNTWHGRETSMTHDGSGVSVTSLRGTLSDSDEPFADLERFMRWLTQYGVNPSGLSSMSWNLLRSSLSSTVTIGADPEITSPAFFGGRQGIDRPGNFFDQQLIDKVAAYPTAMSERPVALSLHEVGADTYLDPTVAGLAQATVVVPLDVPYPPLPVRVGPEAIQFQWGPLNGTWSWMELHHAAQIGCDVVVHRCWAPAREADLFYNWFTMVKEGRGLEGQSSRLAKALANCLWGQFAMLGNDRAQVRWSDERGDLYYVTEQESRHLPHEWTRHVAAEVTARVRNDLSHALYEIVAQKPTMKAAHIDTDGLIISSTDPLPKNMGSDFGQFKVKERMIELDVVAPQFYRFKRPHDPIWHYVASGMNEGQAADTFRHKSHTATRISFMGNPDMVLPDGFSFDWTTNERLYHEARMLR